MYRLGKLVRAAAVAATVAVAAPPAFAQTPIEARPTTAVSSTESAVVAAAAAAVNPCPPQAMPGSLPPFVAGPGSPGMPQAMPSPTSPQSPATPSPSLDFDAANPTFASTLAGAGLGETAAISPGGYIDNATPVTMFRLRYDTGYGMNRPDRGEFFYPKCGCFKSLGQNDANGPPLPEKNIDYQEILPYFEYAFNPRFSMFATVPVRFLNPEVNPNAAGIGDIDFGAKYALIYRPEEVFSFQLRMIAPSGELFRGLGTGNWWMEPGLLYLNQVTPLWTVFGELKDQIHLSRRSNFTGNLLRYGIGTSHVVASGDRGYIAPVVELVGWTALAGKENDDGVPVTASGDTIVNAKIGVRVGIGRPTTPGLYSTNSDLYIGYGRALTGEVWYKDMLRLELRKFFH